MDVFVNLLIILPSPGQEGTCTWLLDFVSDTSLAGAECLDIDGWDIFLLNYRLPLIYLRAFSFVDSVSDLAASLKTGDWLAVLA